MWGIIPAAGLGSRIQPLAFSKELLPVAGSLHDPELFDAVVTDDGGRVVGIQVKDPAASTRWIWGAFKMPGTVLHDLHRLWLERERRDEYFGTLVNAYLARGGEARGVRGGDSYVDVGTLQGYRRAVALLADRPVIVA